MTKKIRRGGRQALPESERKTVLSVRVHPEVRETFERIAATHGGTVSDWVDQTLRNLSDEEILKLMNGMPPGARTGGKIKSVPKP
jgi:hypothetical protein